MHIYWEMMRFFAPGCSTLLYPIWVPKLVTGNTFHTTEVASEPAS
jgi:hypothetical protein